jgi:uncharacterized iron-regulated membrane protein
MRKILFWTHLTLGILVGLIVLFKCVTGVLIVFEDQINALADAQKYHYEPPADAATPLMPEALLAKVKEQKPGADLSGIILHADRKEPAEVWINTESTAFVNPFTGEIVGYGSPTAKGAPETGTRRFFRQMEDLHRWLSFNGRQHETPEAIGSAANVMFLFILISGIFIWFPRKMTWQHFRPAVLFKPGATGKARDWNWHNVIGIWSLVPLLLVVTTGITLSYHWAESLFYTATGSPQPRAKGDKKKDKKKGKKQEAKQQDGKKQEGNGDAQQARGGPNGAAPEVARNDDGKRKGDGKRKREDREDRGRGEGKREGGARERGGNGGGGEQARGDRPAGNAPEAADANPWDGLDRTWMLAEAKVPGWKTIKVEESTNPLLSFEINTRASGQAQRSILRVRRNGEVAGFTDYASANAGEKLRLLARDVHTGELFGFPTEAIMGLATAGACVLVYTGIALALRRLFAWRKRRSHSSRTSGEEVSKAA